jgi:hypothetical protein
MNVSQKEQRRSSIIRHSPPNSTRECDTTTTARPSSDFSSIAPSQSASQVTLNHDHEEEEPLSEPVGIHSVMNEAEPASPSIATTTTVAAPPPVPESEPELEPTVESNTARPRPPSGNSTTTTPIRYSLATPATYTLETVTYAQAIPLHVGGSGAVVTKEPESEREKGPRNSSSSVSRSRSPYTPVSYRDEDREKEQDKGKARDNSPRPRNSTSSVARSGSPYTPISYRDEDLHTTMRIPAPHAIEGYAPGIPTAGPSSGINHFGGGYSTPRSRPSSGVDMPLLQPQPSLQLQPSNLDNGKRHTLDRRITEEELRRRSEEGGVEDEVSSIEEVKARKKLVKEGKIEVVENPKFMTEARRKELERERLREASTPTSTPVVREEKKKFSFFPNPHLRRNEAEGHAAPANQQPVVEHEEEEEWEVVAGASAVPPSSEGDSPSNVTGSPAKHTGSPTKHTGSPSRGWFMSGLKGFFGPRQPLHPNPHPRGSVAQRRRPLMPTPPLPPSTTTNLSPLAATTRTSKTTHRKTRPRGSVARRRRLPPTPVPPTLPPPLPPSTTTDLSPLATTRTSTTTLLPSQRVSKHCSVDSLPSTKQQNPGDGTPGRTTISARSGQRGEGIVLMVWCRPAGVVLRVVR